MTNTIDKEAPVGVATPLDTSIHDGSEDITTRILRERKTTVYGYLSRSYGEAAAQAIAVGYHNDMALVNHFWREVTSLTPNPELPARRKQIERLLADGAANLSAKISEVGFEAATATVPTAIKNPPRVDATALTETALDASIHTGSDTTTARILASRKAAVVAYLNRNYGEEGAEIIAAAYGTDVALVNHFQKDVIRLESNPEIPARAQKLAAMLSALGRKESITAIRTHGFETATDAASKVFQSQAAPAQDFRGDLDENVRDTGGIRR